MRRLAKRKSQRSFSAGFRAGAKRTRKTVGKKAFRAGFNKAKTIGIRKLNHQEHYHLRQTDPGEADYREFQRSNARHID